MYDENNNNNINGSGYEPENNVSDESQQDNVYSSSTNSQQSANGYNEAENNNVNSQSPFEPDGSYHYTGSQIPTDEAYTQNTSTAQSAYGDDGYNNPYQSPTQSTYGNEGYNNPYQSQTQSDYGQGGYQQSAYGQNPFDANDVNNGQSNATGGFQPKPKAKKQKKPVTKGALAGVLAASIILSAGLGFGGGYAATKLFGGNGVTVQQSSGGASTSGSNTSAGVSTSQIVDETANSVVEITTESIATGSYFNQAVTEGAGSGVIISEDGYILTNHHVIDGASNVTVKTKSGDSYTATVVGSDSKLDIALLKVDASGLSPATFGDSSAIQVGDYAVAIGNPLGSLGGTVTDGIISALDRDVTISGETHRLLQTNAAINPGNSGGGLFNADGQLVGIVCAKASSSSSEVEGLGFAIPINDVLDIINDLKQYGYVQGRVEVGLSLTDVTASQGYQPGCYVTAVTSGSSAATAGFTKGDMITKVNGTDVSSSSEVKAIIEKLSVGDTVTFTVKRGTQTGELKVTLEEYKPNSFSSRSSSTNDNSSSAFGGGGTSNNGGSNY